jgi:SAM-dependent methyltransferase
METSTHFPPAVQEWLETPLGNALLQRESRIVEEAFDGIFGEQCLQLGLWGDAQTFLKHSRTQRKCLIDEGFTPTVGAASAATAPNPVGAASAATAPNPVGAASAATAGDAGPSVIGQFHRLPIANDSVDCVLLPHVLDYSDRPHAILREVDRVLTAHGHLAILGFKPGGFWGLRRLIRGAELPPGGYNLVPERRLGDWLQLLDMHIHGITRYFFRWPLTGIKRGASRKWEQRGQRFWPEFAACYMLTAQKRVGTMTPVRPVWRKKPKVVAGLAEPRPRDDQQSHGIDRRDRGAERT